MAFAVDLDEKNYMEHYEWQKLSKEVKNKNSSESSDDKRQDEETVRKTYACRCHIL